MKKLLLLTILMNIIFTIDYNTEILMFDGITKLAGEIRGGDILMGDDSTRRVVQSTHEVYSYGYKIVYNNVYIGVCIT